MANAILAAFPSGRKWPFLVSTRKIVYMWGGLGNGLGDVDLKIALVYKVEKEEWFKQSIEMLNSTDPPKRLNDGGCALAGQYWFLYGGEGGNAFFDKLYEIDTDNWTLKDPSANSSSGGPAKTSGCGGPVKKSGCGMLTYKDHLVIFGGFYGSTKLKSESKQFGSRYENESTNELHYYSWKTGLWLTPPVEESKPPPCSYFSLTMIDDGSAVMFGGRLTRSVCSAAVYLLDLREMVWTQFVHRDGDPAPQARCDHIGVCLGYNGKHKRVLISGGWNQNILSDTWLLDPLSGDWKEVHVHNEKLLERRGHRAATLEINSEVLEVLLVGGDNMASTVAMRFELQEKSSGRKSWILTDVADHTQLGSSERLSEKEELMKPKASKIVPRIAELQQQPVELTLPVEESEEATEDLQRIVNESDMAAEVRAITVEKTEITEELQRKEEELKTKEEQLKAREEELKTRELELEEREAKLLQRDAHDFQRIFSETDNATGYKVHDKDGFLSVGEASVEYTGEATDIKRDDLGIEMHLEDQALPSDVQECSVSVAVAVSGDNDKPEKSEFVSGFYKFDAPFEPEKPVTIRMQHYAGDDVENNLSFASSTDTSPPFVYKFLEGGTFNSTHGTIKIDKFCYYTILEKYGKKGLLSVYQRKYQVSLYLSRNRTFDTPGRLSWNLFFTIVKKCSIFERSVDQYFQEFHVGVIRLNDVVMKFKEDSQNIKLALRSDREELQQGWSVLSIFSSAIQKTEVDNYADGRPPRFCLLLMENKDNPKDLEHYFKLEGMNEPECLIKIFKAPSVHEVYHLPPSHNSLYQQYLEEITSSKLSALNDTIEEDAHIRKISYYLEHWEKNCHLLMLEHNPDVNDICEMYANRPELQRKEALFRWRNKSLCPTYENMLQICAQGGWRKSAKEIISIINNS